MKNRLKITFGAIIAFLSLALANQVKASEGIVEMSNPAQPSVRCYGLSVFDKDRQFKILVSCRNLIYPPSTYELNYVLWASPLGQGDEIYLGDIAPGKLLTKTKTQFDTLYITRENSNKPKTPSSQVILSGRVQPISFLSESEALSQITESETEVQTATQEAQTETEAEEELVESQEASEEAGGRKLPFSNTVFIIAGGILGLTFLLYVVLRKS